MYYSGIDLHTDNSYFTTQDDTGSVVKQERTDNVEQDILAYFRSLPGPHIAVVESTSGWYWLNDLLEANGIELVLAHAKYLKAIAYAKVKTDKVDSQTLATLLRQNLIPRAHKISRELRGLRDTMRLRLRLVQQRTACLRRIDSIRVKFNTAAVPDPYRFQLSVLDHTRDTFTNQILALEKSLHPVLIPNDDIQHLLAVPGIGKLTAIELLVELQDMSRFTSAEGLASYIGLTPAEYSTGERTRQGRITRCGNKRARTYLVESTWVLITKDPYLRAKYLRLKSLRGGKRAVIAIARKLLIRLRRMLLDNVPYRMAA